ncbi:MAG TPA: diguanylate cyclase [Acidobacteriaceae bacterium]|nr:diguanylate cyclase [Acidobacteriaceae bacterium]
MPVDPPPRKILIGESNAFDRTCLKQLLTGWGYAVEAFADGQDALSRLSSSDAPEIALLELDLPGADCAEICRSLRSRPYDHSGRSFQPWIIALSPSHANASKSPGTTESKIGAALREGASDVLTKPVQEAELRLRLHAARCAQTMQDGLRRSIDDFRSQASHDPLTGLWNREALLALLWQETGRAQRTGAPLALILIDLDYFTQCNLESGYKAGDGILRQMATRLRQELRNYDIVGRSGEDEFLILLPGCNLANAVAMAERLRTDVMHVPFQTKNAAIRVGASFGVTQSRGRSPLLVLREAETALAAAKRSGRDRIRRFGPELLPRDTASSELARFRAASLPERAGATDLLPSER